MPLARPGDKLGTRALSYREEGMERKRGGGAGRKLTLVCLDAFPRILSFLQAKWTLGMYYLGSTRIQS